ncbi:MAG: S-methyl-5'-thioadenosine phosphorylase [Planctomycetes bacterium]|nr:S-methyl-5'-thioadenosine phosphorylase [Planctomycetota bacterium]
MSETIVGLIGGSGLGQALADQLTGEARDVPTPFGPPSGPVLMGEIGGRRIAFLSRHGEGHMLRPSAVPYRANIYALKKLGVTHIIASGATGSLQEEIKPRDLVVCDQVIDKTWARPNTFFDDFVAHIEFADPFCPTLRQTLLATAATVDVQVHPSGTYVCMEGPQFSTRAESRLHRQWGAHLIGMTCMPEAKLAREAEICYALVAMATDYDCWREHQAAVDQQALLAEIIGNLNAATANAIRLIRAAVPRVGAEAETACTCRDALKLAIWSDRKRIRPAAIEKLDPIVGRYFDA